MECISPLASFLRPCTERIRRDSTTSHLECRGNTQGSCRRSPGRPSRIIARAASNVVCCVLFSLLRYFALSRARLLFFTRIAAPPLDPLSWRAGPADKRTLQPQVRRLRGQSRTPKGSGRTVRTGALADTAPIWLTQRGQRSHRSLLRPARATCTATRGLIPLIAERSMPPRRPAPSIVFLPMAIVRSAGANPNPSTVRLSCDQPYWSWHNISCPRAGDQAEYAPIRTRIFSWTQTCHSYAAVERMACKWWRIPGDV
jgi:hypothetical protein